jgi:hypothetical protein
MESPMPAPVHVLPTAPFLAPPVPFAASPPVPRAPIPREPIVAHASRLLADLDPAALAELETVSLLNRVDTKFLLPVSQLDALLPDLARTYRVLDVDGRRLHQYRTLYFDTPGFDLYRRHHAGQAVRYKVRSRAYVDSGLAYFEIKAKNERGRTSKHRVSTETLLTELTPAAEALLAEHAPAGERPVEPKLRNDFLRITLVGKACAERVTLDLGIQFECDGRTAILPGAVIAELKQSGVDEQSPFMRLMHAAGRAPTSVSKYCIGVALLVRGVEHDAFESKLRAFEQLARGEAEA